MIKIPDRFKKKLDKASDLSLETSTINRSFSQIYIENNTYFFNEYTDHGFRHINSVLDAIDNLITEDTWKLLGANDVFIIIMSVYLHDIGMHLQPLTFAALINGEYDNVTDCGINDLPWSIIWRDYLEESKKWGEEDLHNVFGNRFHEVSEPNICDLTLIDENDKKLIGEFIRRHHPRIAYEIAFKGLKSHDNTFVDLCPGLSFDLRFLGGLVARSHGMNLRDLFPILRDRYLDAWKHPFNLHVNYLMVLLRLGDYIQIDGSRILKVPFKTKSFRSPVSIFEHQKHFCVINYQPLMDDSETLYFHTTPSNSILFVALKNLFSAIQYEFDTSWAVLGEIYGNRRFKPKLTHRRIKSNLDDNSYVGKLNFIPELIAFSADKELLKLLIAPLYGYDPTYGIRELLQNSIDACWERKELERSAEFDGQVKIKIKSDDSGRHYFMIKDNGKGMNVNEIKNYFLRAGSSLKKSKEWKQQFVSEDNIPSVHRIGKFGIGVLAAYLLGDDIFVETRSHDSESGYRFKTGIDNVNIEIQKASNIEIGTTITIYLADSIRDKILKSISKRLSGNDTATNFSIHSFRWDKWFTLSDPKVTIDIYNFPEFSPYQQTDPSMFKVLPTDWKEFSTQEFAKIRWTYSKKYTNTLLTCNGIVIPKGYTSKMGALSALNMERPFVSVMDLHGKMKLDLNRNGLQNNNELQFELELGHSIYRDIIQEIFSLNIPCKNHSLMLSHDTDCSFSHPSMNTPIRLCFNKNGYVINLPYFNSSIQNRPIIVVKFDPRTSDKNIRIKLTDQKVVFYFLSKEREQALRGEASSYGEASSFEDDDDPFLPGISKGTSDYVKENIILENRGKQIQLSSSFTTNVDSEIFYKVFLTFCEKYFSGLDMVIPYNHYEKIEKYGAALKELNIEL